ncbi:uncharacterized protein SCHCODRAFT_02520224 [Schizophyllum commune H4-8]|uniref:uncharacterized protein n=1 Tax=Schizophyllum commune (strain H4-8 / FGSC 9210) TaxID=578458 RepID=UPI00216050FC|nr:uncharacterized protein SCHCODRAFT_02520224 [Schizophyllum commune H4-8]KAI5885698.1 hypothetical protein SCHCODRAFT_02520224 [Schizophyllum commune H4-8]
MSSPTTPERHRHQERQQARDRINVLETPQHRRTPHTPQLTPVHSQGQQYLLDRPLAQRLRAVEAITPDSLPSRGRAGRRRTRSRDHAQEQSSGRGTAARSDGAAQQQDAPPANDVAPAPSRRGRGSRGRGRGGGRAGRGRRGRGDAHAPGGAQRTTPPPSSGIPTAANRSTPTSTPQRQRDQERQNARERTNILTTPEHRRMPPASILTPIRIDGPFPDPLELRENTGARDDHSARSRSPSDHGSVVSRNESPDHNMDGVPPPLLRRLPLARRPVANENAHLYLPLDLGEMTAKCTFCNALHWLAERLKKSRINLPQFGTCCLSGKVQIPLLAAPPDDLYTLFYAVSDSGASEVDRQRSRHFLQKVRRYNAAFAFASLGVSTSRIPGRGVQQFTIRGELFHELGAVLPGEDPSRRPKYAQLYFMAPDDACEQRYQNNLTHGLRTEILQIIQDVLLRCNGYIDIYKLAVERLRDSGRAPSHFARLDFRPGSDQRRYNLPTAAELAVVLEDSKDHNARRDIMIELRRGGRKHRIYDTHPAYQPLLYVLLFPRGEHGYHENIPLTNPTTGEAIPLRARVEEDEDEEGADEGDEEGAGHDSGNKRGKQTRVTPMEFFAFRLHRRLDESDHIFRAKMLFQQYIVDGWAQTEQTRLRWARGHQPQLRADVYRGLADAVSSNADVNPQSVGQRCVLPSSFVGSWRNMFQLYQDSMAVARFFGRPDYFLTITCNPQWPEIQKEVEKMGPGFDVTDRPDLVSRVFREKVSWVVSSCSLNC